MSLCAFVLVVIWVAVLTVANLPPLAGILLGFGGTISILNLATVLGGWSDD